MTAKIIDGKELAQKVRNNVKKSLESLNITPGLAVILVGKNPASQVYVRMKERACKEVGIHFERFDLDEGVNEIDVLKLIDELNQRDSVHGILVQLPLPSHLDEKFIIESILPHKDVDGFTPINLGNLLIGANRIVPATPKAIIKLIESTNIDIEGLHAVVVGRSNIVGKPVSLLLQQKDATVTMCHSKSKPLKRYTRQADILVVAVGKPNLITGNMVKKGAIVIDVGINRVGKKLIGDVDFESVKNVASYITPVPGGVGPMTIACLLENIIECVKLAKL